MRNIYIIITGILIGLTACIQQQEKSKETYFYTQDSLYKISFVKPIELDTFYAWMDEDDNACSDEHKYRFSKKNFPAQKETGFFWLSLADSTYRITVKHVEKYACKQDMDNELHTNAKDYKTRLEEKAKYDQQSIKILFVKEIKIDNKKFLMCAYKTDEHYKNKYWTHYLRALTTVDSNMVVFTADCRSNNCEGFIEKMEKTFQTIKISRK